MFRYDILATCSTTHMIGIHLRVPDPKNTKLKKFTMRKSDAEEARLSSSASSALASCRAKLGLFVKVILSLPSPSSPYRCCLLIPKPVVALGLDGDFVLMVMSSVDKDMPKFEFRSCPSCISISRDDEELFIAIKGCCEGVPARSFIHPIDERTSFNRKRLS